MLFVLLAAFALLLTTAKAAEDEHWVRRVHAPSIVDPRDELVVLRCDYDLLPGQELDSVNWYKDGADQQIFRFMPSLETKGQSFPHKTDVNISLERSNGTHLVLLGHRNVTKNVRAYEGNYLCEVQMQGTYMTDYASANVSAAILPRQDPVIEGMAPNYHLGEQLDVTCSSAPTLPATELSFFVNNKKVERVRTQQTIVQNSDGSSSTKLSLSMRLDRIHFVGDSLKLSCRATLPGLKIKQEYKTERTSNLAAQRLAQELPSIFASSSSANVRAFGFITFLSFIILL